MASSTRTRRRGDDENDRRTDRLAEAYLHWLIEQVHEEGHHASTYWDILRLMHMTEFVWLVPNDDNRIQDGLDLRAEFIAAHRTRFHDAEGVGPCTVLEVLVGLSRRVAFVAGGPAEGWAWQLVCNLEMHKFRDPLSARKRRRAEEMLHALVWRTYDPDGSGGFFPLAWPQKDQTKVELWYQMSAYVEEIHPEY